MSILMKAVALNFPVYFDLFNKSVEFKILQCIKAGVNLKNRAFFEKFSHLGF